MASSVAQTSHSMHQHHVPAVSSNRSVPSAMTADTRTAVKFPAPLKAHTLASMRDHLHALLEINEALADQDFEKASQIAEWRLGMSSLEAHGAHESGKYMPKGMQDTGMDLHRNASRFAVSAQEAAATGDLAATLKALSKVQQSCVACHAAYRLD
ncbi:MAG TPA: hypothetical protein VHK70_09075 [Burkholderiaceae bacterium]|nr:hypothetical protein [Burkholderiaceae bacterium]